VNPYRWSRAALAELGRDLLQRALTRLLAERSDYVGYSKEAILSKYGWHRTSTDKQYPCQYCGKVSYTPDHNKQHEGRCRQRPEDAPPPKEYLWQYCGHISYEAKSNKQHEGRCRQRLEDAPPPKEYPCQYCGHISYTPGTHSFFIYALIIQFQ